MDNLTTNLGTVPTRHNGQTLPLAAALAQLRETLRTTPPPVLPPAEVAIADSYGYSGRALSLREIMGDTFWHKCWCPEEFLTNGFNVSYCPVHGHPDLAAAEFTEVKHCGGQCCTQVQEQYAWEQHQQMTHLRDTSFIDIEDTAPATRGRV